MLARNHLNDVKILVAGHVGSGKTTLIETLSDIEMVSTEKVSKNHSKSETESKKGKSSITTTLDFGVAYNGKNSKIRIFGIPGHKRFSFMWEILLKGTDGYIFLLDSTVKELWYDTLEQIEIFLNENPAPFILVANKQDLPDAYPIDKIRDYLDIPDSIPLLPCVAKDKDSVLDVIDRLLDKMLELK